MGHPSFLLGAERKVCCAAWLKSCPDTKRNLEGSGFKSPSLKQKMA
jgi:hypothetical protein